MFSSTCLTFVNTDSRSFWYLCMSRIVGKSSSHKGCAMIVSSDGNLGKLNLHLDPYLRHVLVWWWISTSLTMWLTVLFWSEQEMKVSMNVLRILIWSISNGELVRMLLKMSLMPGKSESSAERSSHKTPWAWPAPLDWTQSCTDSEDFSWGCFCLWWSH